MSRREILLAITVLFALPASAQEPASPTLLRENFLSWKFGMFIHFNMATFHERELATGYEDPKTFAPDKLDCRQWLDAAAGAGMEYAVLTVKHTGAWCLWDSRHTESHDITAFVNYKGGKGDIVREFVEACRERGIKAGLYYCFPGNFAGEDLPEGKEDLHGLPPEAKGDYPGFIKKQLGELLTQYGPIDLLWVDQWAKHCSRKDWLEIKRHIKSRQPNCIVIANNSHNFTETDIHSFEYPWLKKVNPAEALPPKANENPAEVCDYLGPAWFWKARENHTNLKTAEEVVAMLDLCNSRQANYLLNVAPDRSGLIPAHSVERLREIGKLLSAPKPPPASGTGDAFDAYNVVWTTPSKDSSESMPCGGGDTGLNVWVEDGDVLFYIQRSGSLAEQNEYLKLGRVRLRLDPNPFGESGTEFRQELKLRNGHVEIEGRAPGPDGKPIKSLVRIWVDVHRPVIHLEVESGQPVRAKASYENWRLEDEQLPAGTRRHSCITLQNYPGEVTLSKDTVSHSDKGVLFYHRNPDDARVLNALLKQQGLEKFRDEIVDDLSNRTFGGLMTGSGFKEAGYSEGVYQAKKFGAWHLQSEQASRKHHLRVITHIDQAEQLEVWQAALDHSARMSAGNVDSARTATRRWWHEFWDRSHIIIKPGNPDPTDRAWRIARNYNLFRYQLGCNAFGEYPTKFNGGNFTVDANLIGDKWEGFGPDWRQWGGGVFTAQNQRLIYWPMLKSGDVDAILPQFELYRKALPGAQARVKENFKHDGAIYAEYIGAAGLATGSGYGWEGTDDRGRGQAIPFGDPRADALHNYGDPIENGVMAAKSISYHWESQLEHAYMILEYRRFTGADISKYIPLIENAVVFFDQHYRKREKMRSGKELDGNGHLVIYPSKACESFRGATNPADVIAALHACVDGILTLDDDALALRDKAFYQTLKDSIPPYEYSEGSEDDPHPMMKDLVRALRNIDDCAYARGGVRTILPARSWNEYGNGELPMLYPLFPFNRFALGRDDMQVFRDTYEHGFFRKGRLWSWHQDGIFFARMGQTEKAADFNSRKLDDSGRRFPTFWGPGHDWVPDHNWGGSGMIGLQEMLMQTIGGEIRLLPAWPKEWDVDFKLHAPHKTTVTGKVRGGKVVDLEVSPASRKADVVVGLQEAKPE